MIFFYFGNQFPHLSQPFNQNLEGGIPPPIKRILPMNSKTSSHQKELIIIVRIILNRIGLWKQKIGNPLTLAESCSESSVPSLFLVESISTAVHLINRLSSQKLQHQSPYLRMCGQWTSSSYNHLHTFGCLSISKRVYFYDPSIRHIQTFLNANFVKNKFFQHHDGSLPSSSNSYIHDFMNSPSQDLNLRLFIYEENIMKHLQKGTPIVSCLPTPNPSLDPLPLCRSIQPTRPPDLNSFPDALCLLHYPRFLSLTHICKLWRKIVGSRLYKKNWMN